MYVWEGEYLTFITYHPSAALRNQEMEKVLHADIDLVRWVAKDELPLTEFVSVYCTICGEFAEFYDPNLAGYCPEHWFMKAKKNMPTNQQAWHMSTREGQWKGKGRKRGSAIPLGLFGEEVGRRD